MFPVVASAQQRPPVIGNVAAARYGVFTGGVRMGIFNLAFHIQNW